MTREGHVRFCESAGVRSPRATHLVVGFEHKADAERFRTDMKERMARFALTLHPDKTRLIEFGGLAAANRKRRGAGNASTSSAGDIRLPRLHAYLRAHSARRLFCFGESPGATGGAPSCVLSRRNSGGIGTRPSQNREAG
jgi:hypothetical protein